VALSRAVFLFTGPIDPDILPAKFPLSLFLEVYFPTLKMKTFCLPGTPVAQPHTHSASIHKIGSESKYEIAADFLTFFGADWKASLCNVNAGVCDFNRT